MSLRLELARARTWAALGALAVLGWAGAPRAAAGQSVLAAGGLGVPVEPVDARGRALGSVGPGLFSTAVIPGDPTAALGLTIPTVVFSMQSSWLTADHGGSSISQTATRFPALGVAYPVRTWGVLTLTYGGFLDQRWAFNLGRQLDIGGGVTTAVTDHFVSDGGIAGLRVAGARRLGRHVGVGASIGTYTGNVLRRFSRTFDSLGVNVTIDPFQIGGRWSYSGTVMGGAVSFDAADVVRAAATVEWSAGIDARPDSASSITNGAQRSYKVPLQLRAGASARLAPGLSVTTSVAYADWTDTGADLVETTSAGSTTAFGAGVEWERATVFGRALPLRLGWKRAGLPFHLEPDDDPVESAFGGGLGILLARTGDTPLARFDIALERGSRSGGSVGEDFWRTTMTFRAAGF